MEELFPSSFVAALEPLRLAVGPSPAGGSHGEHRARARGSGFDFRDFQAYSHGDDLRRVDWNIYRRQGHLFLRRYDHVRTLPVYLLVDVSASMFFEQPTRYAMAARVAAAVACAALREHDSLEVWPLGAPARPALRRVTGRQRLAEVLRYLAAQEAEVGADRDASVERIRREVRRPGIAVVISDFFDDRGVEAVTDALSKLNHRTALVRVTQPGDAEPELTDELELVDCESGAVRAVSPEAALAEYRRAYTHFVGELERHATGRGSRCSAVDASATDSISQLGRVFPGGVMMV